MHLSALIGEPIGMHACMCFRRLHFSIMASVLAWLRSTYIRFKPIEHCVFHVTSHRACYVVVCIAHAMLLLRIVYTMLCVALLFGIGVSPNTRNEGRFILQVMKRASILGRRRS